MVELPQDTFGRLNASWSDVSRGVLEDVAVEGHHAGLLIHYEVARLLGLSFWHTEAFLEERRAHLVCTQADFDQDRHDIDRVGGQ